MSTPENQISSILVAAQEIMESLGPYLNDPVRDKAGQLTGAFMGRFEELAMCSFLLHSDRNVFSASLSEAAKLKLALYIRFEAGEPIDESYLSMLSYQSLFNALAAGDWSTSQALARKLGGRDRIEAEHDHPFDRAMGYALKSVTLDLSDVDDRLKDLFFLTKQSEHSDFAGYARGFGAIANRDSQSFPAALETVVAGHERQSRGSGGFNDMLNSRLSIWGIGLANLARTKGLDFDFDHPFIPSTLIVGVLSV